MKRRQFLAMSLGAVPLNAVGASAFLSPPLRAEQPGPGATVLYDGRAIALAGTNPDPAKGNALWIEKSDLPRINDFELKPQGACRADVCIPIPRAMTRGTAFNLSAFAQRVGQRVVADTPSRVWSFGEIPVVRGAYLESRMAPEIAVPDRTGKTVRLSQFRGKKVLLVTWASW